MSEASDGKQQTNLLSLTGDVVVAYLNHNRVAGAELPEFIAGIYKALQRLGNEIEASDEKRPDPAVPIRQSIKPDHIVCLEDGKKLTMLKRYLRTNYSMSPAEYRARWKLPADYPMIAPNYAARRAEIAKASGFGRKPSKHSLATDAETQD